MNIRDMLDGVYIKNYYRKIMSFNYKRRQIK